MITQIDNMTAGMVRSPEINTRSKEALMKVGDTFQHPTNSRRPKCHVRGIVDGLLVIRWWRASKQCWEYEVLDPEQVKQ